MYYPLHPRTTYFFSVVFSSFRRPFLPTSSSAFAAFISYTYIIYIVRSFEIATDPTQTRNPGHCRRRTDGISNVCIPIHNIIILSRPPPAHPFVGFSRVFLTRTAPRSAGSRCDDDDRGKAEDGKEKK